MALNDQIKPEELVFDKNNLYREESFTDLKAGSIKRLVPVTADGSPDSGRPPLFMAQTQIMSPSGPLPIQCVIEAGSLSEAMDKFPAAIKETVDKIIDEARRMQREAATGIVVPGQDQINKIIT